MRKMLIEKKRKREKERSVCVTERKGQGESIIKMLKDFSNKFNRVLSTYSTMCSCIINLEESHAFQ